MLLYTDTITNDELFSDAFPVKKVDDTFYEVDCAMITVKSGADIDIGANPSAEEQAEALEDGAVQVNNIVHSFRLHVTEFTKQSYKTYVKTYVKALKQKRSAGEDDIREFEARAIKGCKKIIDNFSDYEFYTGESMNPDGMVALLNYREDGITPYFTFWKDGVDEQKL